MEVPPVMEDYKPTNITGGFNRPCRSPSKFSVLSHVPAPYRPSGAPRRGPQGERFEPTETSAKSWLNITLMINIIDDKS